MFNQTYLQRTFNSIETNPLRSNVGSQMELWRLPIGQSVKMKLITQIPELVLCFLPCTLWRINDTFWEPTSDRWGLVTTFSVDRRMGVHSSERYGWNILCPSIFWGPRLIARSPRRRQREKNLEPQKIDGLSKYHTVLFQDGIHINF